MNMGILIREASREDVDVITETIRAAFKDVADRFGLTPENSPRRLENASPAGAHATPAKKIPEGA
jgi:hypothetical protein